MRTNRLYAIVGVFLMSIGLGALYSPAAESSYANVAGNLRRWPIGDGKYTYTYDFRGAAVNSQYVDWPISTIFYGNANINKVKNRLGVAFPVANGGRVYQFFEQPSASGFDSDRGIKDKAALCFGTDFHTRIYAPSATDYVYTTKFGYMVIGSTHKDHNDGCHGSYYDQNEQTEYRVWATILNARGAASVVAGNAYFLGNQNHSHQDNHLFNNNGYASMFKMN